MFATQLKHKYIMENELMTALSAGAVEDEVRQYLGDSIIKVSVTMIGRFAVTDIVYRDFKPKRTVRRDLEDLIPNIEIDSIERIFSKDAQWEAIDELMNEGVEFYIMSDGKLISTTLALLVSEVLHNKTLE